MKIKQQSTKNNKRILLIIVILLAAMLTYGLFAFATNSWPFHSGPDNKSQNVSDEDKKSTTDEDTDKNNDITNNNPQKPNTNTNNDSTVAVPPIDTPDAGEKYPIENSHYRINKPSTRRFEVTLYPIAGNQYDNQLKQYKQEVLSYLSERYGDISQYTIDWNPPSAKEI